MSSQPRRNRYQATGVTLHGQPHSDIFVLAYTLEGAKQALVQKGYGAVSIAPHRREDIQGGGFKIDQAALKAAQDFLGLTLPVKVRHSSKLGATQGNYRLSHRRGNHHNVMLKSYLTPEQASKTLWHELAHAMQAERACKTAGVSPTDRAALLAWSATPERAKGTGYYKKPIEVEARAHENYAATRPLAVAS